MSLLLTCVGFRVRHLWFNWNSAGWLSCPLAREQLQSCTISASAVRHSKMEDKRPQFGNRHLTDPNQVFQHNAWDNVQWSDEQESAARKKVQENSCQPVPPEKQDEYENKASGFWDDFYTIHENRFFKDRHWLFTEFPELSSSSSTSLPLQEEQIKDNGGGAFPGASASYRIMEVGCGVGNTVFPILKNNADRGVFVYCCDFSSTAVELVKSNEHYDPTRCFAFVHDLSDEHASYPMSDQSLDVIVLIFVLSAIHPDKMQGVISHLSRLLKPGGCILLRDYGRYDMAQLRFKKGRCLSDNFYVRGDGTRVYFFTQDELGSMFTNAGLEKVQNIVDRRLQVNRGKQLTMYRVWIQCKYRRPCNTEITDHALCLDQVQIQQDV
ncbi:tRNA N(3)-methylcytidine methyltransferase METTL2 [Bombina bombina]|uniref:tRNA N(3)-methylcytidine methyltransferase METTL2 n=1 Tax=Bombina bombina TaxID=8345 RepID=UPI00235A7537|nr:tRNA N(3)-methylcytidine methyltransferase METTL2 [Bombina bombina]XP_053555735.1 tRNA N(3)-methylcytidine methyltransferase METTL2 [Bombina bombina]